ncbi:MAG: ABC transporter permease [Opitutaceae bacterium]
MKHFFTILGHEIRMLLVSPGTYLAAALFLALMGFEFVGILDRYSQAPQGVAPASAFFHLFWLPVLFLVPLLTMKCLAEERRQGTLETLLTTPVTTAEVVLGKYGAAYALYIALWAATGVFFVILRHFAGTGLPYDPGPLEGGYLFIAISGLLFVAIGVLASALVRSQAVAGIVAFTLLFGLIFGGGSLADASWIQSGALSSIRSVVDYGQVFRHYEDFARGVVDLRQVLFYLSGTVLVLIFSVLGVEAKLLHH